MKKQWITTKELAKIKNISERAVRKSIATRKYVTRKCGKSYEILVTSLEENVRKNLHDLGWGNSFLDNIPRATATKGKTDQLDLSSLVL